MLRNLAKIIELAGLEDEATFSVVRSSAAAAPLTTGALLVLVDDPLGLATTLRHYPAEHAVRVVDRDERVSASTVAELLQDSEHAAALILDPIDLFELRNAPEGVRGVIDRLRDPDDGCPWDNAQTHLSLRPHLLEETYEVLEAIAGGDPAHLCEELGDLLMQVVLHAKLAEQDGHFSLDDVAEGIRAKLVRRHPHVFGDASADSAAWVEGAWERLKARERPNRESVLDGVPKTLPALARAQSLLGRAERNGFARQAGGSDDPGERALDLVLEARAAGIQLEDAVRDALDRFERGVRAVEAEGRGGG